MKYMNIICSFIILYFSIVSINAPIPGVKDMSDKYCNDLPMVSINAIVMLPNGKIYAFFEELFVQINSITANGLPVISDDSPKMINKFWGELPDHLETGFVFNNKVYFLKNRILWKHDPQVKNGSRVEKIDIENEFAFFKGRSDIYENILSVWTEPNPMNKKQPIFVITFMAMKENQVSDRYMKTISFDGNSTKEIGNPSEIIIEQSVNDLLYQEYLVLDNWQYINQTVFKSLWFLNKIHFNLIEGENSRQSKLKEVNFNPSVVFRTIGYNQIWLGCPQPLCLDSTIDTIVVVNDDFNPLTAFRGRFYWEITKGMPPFTLNAQLISDGYKGLPSHLDTSYYDFDTKELVFFKNEFYYVLIGENWVQKRIVNKFPGVKTPIDAVFYVSKTEEFYIFKGYNYIVFQNKKNKISKRGQISEFSQLPNYIDGAFVANDTVYIFKSWYYYRIDIKDYNGVTGELRERSVSKPEQVFTPLFFCPENVYSDAGFENLSKYLKKYMFATKPIPAKDDKRIPIEKPIKQTTTETTQKTTENPIESNNNTPDYSTNTQDSNSWEGSDSTKPGLISTPDEQEIKHGNGSNNWIFYIIIVVILVIGIFIIGFVVLRNSSKSESKTDKNKAVNESKLGNESDKNKFKKPDDTLFSYKFEDEDEKSGGGSLEGSLEGSRESQSPQPLKRVSTEFFVPTKTPKLEPQHKLSNHNLFVNYSGKPLSAKSTFLL